MNFKRLADQELRGKRVFIRADLNVPQDEAGDITDATRISASVPASVSPSRKGAAVMVTSHLGRPEGGRVRRRRIRCARGETLSELLGFPIA
jgi:phosphoglycerate kinase